MLISELLTYSEQAIVIQKQKSSLKIILCATSHFGQRLPCTERYASESPKQIINSSICKHQLETVYYNTGSSLVSNSQLRSRFSKLHSRSFQMDAPNKLHCSAVFYRQILTDQKMHSPTWASLAGILLAQTRKLLSMRACRDF